MARLRDFIWVNPRRARMAVVAAVLVAVAAGGTFVGLRPGGGADGRLRHRQFSGALDATGEGGPATGDTSTIPGATVGTNGPGGAGAPTEGAPGTAASGPGGTGDATSTGQGSTPGATDAPVTGPSSPTSQGRTRPSTPTSAPGSGRGAAPSSPAAGPPGWGLLPKAPIGGRANHTAIWTGREMVLWGGSTDFESDPFTDGAAFNPATRTWRMVPAAPLSPRIDARAFWTGREMIIYGGTSAVEGVILDDGAAWDPASNRWRALPGSPLGPRDGSVVAWAGDRLVVWGGSTVLPDNAPEDAETELKNDGAAYVPATNGWVPVPAAPIVPRAGADSVWSGTRFVVTGGHHVGDDDDRVDGAAFDPVWTGKVALFPVSGVAYDPAADRWSTMAPVPTRDGPAPGEPVVWTGERLLSWGINAGETDDPGADAGSDGPPPVRGGSYDPVADRWQTFPAGPLGTRVTHTAVWTGQEMLVWGGTSGETALGDGAAFRPE